MLFSCWDNVYAAGPALKQPLCGPYIYELYKIVHIAYILYKATLFDIYMYNAI